MFYNNIKALEKVNKKLANKITKISLETCSKDLSAIKNENGEYILVKNEKYIDDTPSPNEAAEKIYLEQIKKASSRHDFILIFGLGLGNLLDYVHTKSITSLILYEPDLNILRFTFEYVDLTKYFVDGRLYITDNITDCINYISEKYLIDDKIEFVYLKNYLLMHTSEFTALTEKIFETCQSKIIDLNTIKKLSKYWIKNIILNATSDSETYPVNILENSFKNKTALILGAGPSLKDNIEKIKTNRDKYIILAVHKVLETLRINNITPDFCVVIDSNWVKPTITKDTKYLRNINVIADIKADNYLKSLPFKNFFTYYSQNNIFSNKLQIKLLNEIKALETGGTSTICAYRCAKFMGFKKIIFAGLDLAFKDDTAYCDGQIASANNSTSVKIQGVIVPTLEVKSITGEYIKTRADYAGFIKQFELLFAHDITSEIYNLSTFGAFINGMKYTSLDEILTPETITINEIIENLTNENKFISEKIKQASIEILKEEKRKISPLIDRINEWFEMYAEHPSFFDYATSIVTSITSTMILQDYVQVELMKFSKLVLSKNIEEKKEFLKELFITILNYSKNLDNLI